MADETYEVSEIVDELLTKKRGIKEIIKEMKNVSELMVDLAYSAILFNNNDLAEEVKGLEEEMNKLRLQIEISAMLAARTSEDASKLSGIIRVAAAAESISNAAERIADTVLRDIELHPVLKEALEEAEETVERIIVTAKSGIDGMAIKDIRDNEKYAVDILCIKRGGEWIFDPKWDVKLKTEDMVIVTGFKENVEQFKDLVK